MLGGTLLFLDTKVYNRHPNNELTFDIVEICFDKFGKKTPAVK